MSTQEATTKAQPVATKKAKVSEKTAKAKKAAKKAAKASKAKGGAKSGSKAAVETVYGETHDAGLEIAMTPRQDLLPLRRKLNL